MNDTHTGPVRAAAADSAPATVSLSWYELEETRGAVDELWRRLARRLRELGQREVPQALTRAVDPTELLHRPGLLLTQTCGFVAGGAARGLVKIVATPCYGAPGCRDGTYSSFIAVRRDIEARQVDELRGMRCAVSDPLAHSGCNALRALVAPMHRRGRFFAGVIRSGGHLASLERLADGSADVAAIDCITWELVRRFRPRLLARVRVLACTAPAPAPPFVTSRRSDEETMHRLRQALAEVIRDPGFAPLRRATMLEDVTTAPAGAYSRLPALAREARDGGYVEMDLGET